jgi:hypothetical protein
MKGMVIVLAAAFLTGCGSGESTGRSREPGGSPDAELRGELLALAEKDRLVREELTAKGLGNLTLEDEAGVDRRRAELGLPSLKEYRQMLEEAYGLPAAPAGS